MKKLSFEQFCRKIMRYDRKHPVAQDLAEQYPEYYKSFSETMNSISKKFVDAYYAEYKKNA